MGDDQVISFFIKVHWNLEVSVGELPGYQDRNFLVTCSSGEQYVLKITTDPTDLEFIRSQNRVLLELSKKSVGSVVPCPQHTVSGEFIEEINADGITGYARLFPFLPGQFLAQASPELGFYKELGRYFALIDQGMAGLEDAVLKCRTHEWDLSRVMELYDDIDLVADPSDRRLVHYFLMKYREEVVPVHHKLPKGLIHADGNDWNIIVGDGVPAFAGMTKEAPAECGAGDGVPAFAGMTKEAPAECGAGDGVPAFAGMTKEAFARMTKEALLHTNSHTETHTSVAGVLDFGDMLWGPRVNEVAIVLAYAMMGSEDFREIYQQVIDGYQKVIRLSEIELSALHYLVAARWCQTLVMAARQEKARPGSAYHQVSVEGARRMLNRWIRENSEGVTGVTEVTEVKNVKNVKNGVEERYNYFSKAVSLSYKEPIRMVGAAMQYMYGADGKTYLDCVNNIPHVGHCHPKVVEAGQRQMARLNTNTRYLYKSLDRYAEKLLSKFPPSLCKVFFVNSGSAATDLAVRLAESYTGQRDYLVLDYAYHGNTQAAIGLSPYKFNRKGGKGKPGNVTVLTPPPAGISGQLADLPQPLPGPPPNPLLMKEGEPLLQTFFAESIVGCAGQIVLSKDFMQQTVTSVREGGGIYVADEVQTGFGRVGHKFWGFELYDVIPDMVILGKPMGNGHPMGAVICTEDIARSFETGMEFFSSFGGNPVSCEIGLAVLGVIEEEGLQENAREVGDFLLSELSRQLAVGSWQSAIGSRQSAVGSRQSAVGSWQQAVGNRQLATGSKQYAVGNEQSADEASRHASRVTRHDSPASPEPAPAKAGVTCHVSDVRGSGLFLGIELADPATGQPATDAARQIVNSLKDRGILLNTDGPFNNVIKFKPPMCFSMENAVELISAFRELIL